MTEFLRHGEEEVLMSLLGNIELTRLWQNDRMPLGDASQLLDLTTFTHEYTEQISFRRREGLGR